MAADAAKPLANGTDPTGASAIQLSMALPNAPGSRIHMHLTILATSILLFLTSTTGDSAAGATDSEVGREGRIRLYAHAPGRRVEDTITQ